MKTRCHLLYVGLLAAALALFALPSCAQSFPARPIRIIVSAPAGAGQDVEVRQLTPHLATDLGVPVVVENRPGGAGLLGLAVVAKGTADGYTLGASTIGNLASHPRLFDRPPYDVERDLTPLSLTLKHPWVFYVHPSVPAQTFQQFITLAKAKPESITYASPGVGSFTQLTVTLLQTLTGARLRHIPYGAQPWQLDLLGGSINASMWPLITMVEHVKSGKLRALAISNGQRRSPQVPDVPLFSELGLAQFDPSAWAGLVVPAGTPRLIVDKLSTAAARAARTPQYLEFTAEIGATAVGSTSAEFDAFARTERARWKKVIADNGIKLE